MHNKDHAFYCDRFYICTKKINKIMKNCNLDNTQLNLIIHNYSKELYILYLKIYNKYTKYQNYDIYNINYRSITDDFLNCAITHIINCPHSIYGFECYKFIFYFGLSVNCYKIFLSDNMKDIYDYLNNYLFT